MTTTTENPPIIITPRDLPLYCAGPKNETWNGHPRVYLALQSNGNIECPYCGTRYHLNGELPHHHY